MRRPRGRRPLPIRLLLLLASAAVLVAVDPACTGPATVRPLIPWLAPPAPNAIAHGVLVTPTGVVAPILASDRGGAWVRTPCFRLAWVKRGTRIDAADIVLDPGHGGPELGAVAPTGLEEKVPNLAIAQRVAVGLERDGQRVVTTRTGDAYYLTIRTRSEIVRALNPRLVLSIHHNAAGPPPRKGKPGTEVFHQRDSEPSRVLADHLAATIVDAFSRYDIAWSYEEGRAGAQVRISEDTGLDYYGILRYDGTIPTVITEAAFLSNPAEAELLATDAFRQTEADAIVAGVRAYLRDADPAPIAPPAFEPFPAGPPADAEDCRDPLLA
jgi:N-acetylmuramoyl-L-alanine amidase